MERIYLDNCLTTKPDPQILNAMMPYLTKHFYYPSNFVSTGSAAKKAIDGFKDVIAGSLNADKSEIHLTSGGTAANNIGIKGFIMANAERGNHIICSQIDYPDMLTNAAFFEESGFEVTYLSADKDGFIDLDELKSSITKNTILVMTTLANHVLGTIQPIKQIKEIIGSNIALFVDAGHAYGRMPIDVSDKDVDMLSFSAHKIHGPQGAGALYVKKGIQLAQTKHGINRMDEFDTGGMSMANLAGMAKAVELQFNDLDKHIKHMRGLQTRLYEGLSSVLSPTYKGGVGGDQNGFS